jgi:hypothetical protein
MTNKQAVVRPRRRVRHRSAAGPRAESRRLLHQLAQEGAYDGTTFHRMVKYGIIQGGDPLTKDPAKAKYGRAASGC